MVLLTLAFRCGECHDLHGILSEQPGFEPAAGARSPNPHVQQAVRFLMAFFTEANQIARMFYRLKDYCPIATCYGKLANGFLGGIYFAATVT